MNRPLLLTLILLFTFSYAETKSARTAMLFCLLPGGGQFYTDRYFAGVAIASAEITLGYCAYIKHRDHDFEKRNSYLWWNLFVFGYSLADAYVGAKLHDFSIETDLDRVSIGYRLKW